MFIKIWAINGSLNGHRLGETFSNYTFSVKLFMQFRGGGGGCFLGGGKFLKGISQAKGI